MTDQQQSATRARAWRVKPRGSYPRRAHVGRAAQEEQDLCTPLSWRRLRKQE